MKYYRLYIKRTLSKTRKVKKKLFGFIPITSKEKYEEPFTVMTDVILYDDCKLTDIYVKYLVDRAVLQYLYDMNIPEKEHPSEVYKDGNSSDIEFKFQPILFEDIDTLLLFTTEQRNLYNQIDVFGEDTISIVYSNTKNNTHVIDVGSRFDFVTGVIFEDSNSSKNNTTLLLEEFEVEDIIFCLKSDIHPDYKVKIPYRRLMSSILMDEKIIESIKKENEE